MSMETSENVLRLDAFLQLKGLVGSGGQAKVVIQGGDVKVNGEQETRRGKKLQPGDAVSFAGNDYVVKI